MIDKYPGACCTSFFILVGTLVTELMISMIRKSEIGKKSWLQHIPSCSKQGSYSQRGHEIPNVN